MGNRLGRQPVVLTAGTPQRRTLLVQDAVQSELERRVYVGGLL